MCTQVCALRMSNTLAIACILGYLGSVGVLKSILSGAKMPKKKPSGAETHHFSPRPNKAHLIEWRHWGDEAFKMAQDADKPVFLNIGAVWCHWCHVFDETTLSDPDVIDILNRDFVPIRVDADKNPHIQNRYLAGGWPTNTFLTPTGNTISGGTYIRPDEFKGLAEKVSKYYADHKSELYASIAHSKVRKSLGRESERVAEGQPTGEIPGRVTGILKDTFDHVHGGFGSEPKFPQQDVIELLLTEYLINGDMELLDMATKTLDNMMEGGLWDNVEKGFFRYATRSDWSVPHYEKMLEGNASLLKDYLLGYQVTGKEGYRKVAEDVISYLDAKLSSPDGGFYGSQDADENYYMLDAEARKKENPPKVDTNIYTNWNGMAISGYLHAYQALGHEPYGDRAVKAIGHLTASAYRAGKGMYHYVTNGEAELRGLLVDQVFMADALVSAYETTMERRFLETAIDIMDCVTRDLRDPRKGGFFDIPEDDAQIGNLAFREKPLMENTRAMRVLNRLHHLTGKEEYHNLSLETAQALIGTFTDYSVQASSYALAVREYLEHPVQITIIGSKSDPRTLALHKEGLGIFLPWKVIQVLDPKTDPLQLGPITYSAGEEPLAYGCQEGMCSPPMRTPEELKAFMQGK